MDDLPPASSENLVRRGLPPGGAQILEFIEQCRRFSDDELTRSLGQANAVERSASAILIAHLMVFDERRLWVEMAFPSLFAYCVCVLGLSEAAAYKRIAAARVARKCPAALEWLSSGRITLSALAVLSPHLTADNAEHLLGLASGKSKFELERIVAGIAPKPDRGDVMRRLPEPVRDGLASLEPKTSVPGVDSAPAPAPPSVPARVKPLSPGRVSFNFTGSERLRDKLERVKQLRWHCDPKGRLEVLVEALADYYLYRKDPDRRIARKRAKGL